jgi:hypothetical protein
LTSWKIDIKPAFYIPPERQTSHASSWGQRKSSTLSSPLGERIKVRGRIISTLTPALSRQRERGLIGFP